jgi:hypothetical protein
VKNYIALILMAVILMVPAAATGPSNDVCYEDMACWNCATMGNGLCGPRG